MLRSRLFAKSFKYIAEEEKSKNAYFLLKGGFIDRLTAGVYSFLPLGFRVLKKIENIIREEMVRIGALEIFLPAIHPKANWIKTGRWESMDDLYKLETENLVLGPTHEEIISPLMKRFISTYRDLPVYVFQIQTKFRKEARAKSGLLRGREFLMKDLYSFHRDEKDLDKYYKKVKKSYFRIFNRLGIGKYTYLTLASGGSFSEYSHEFQTLTEAGEDTIYICKKCGLAINKEIKNKFEKCPVCGGKNFEEKKAIEVGNIFKLYTKYSSPFGLNFLDKDGKEKPVVMGCYGIGLNRVMGTIVEVSSDEKGIIWPLSVAPFHIHLLYLPAKDKKNNKRVFDYAKDLYNRWTGLGLEVLFDDRKRITSGEKLVEADLLGIPFRVVVSERTLKLKVVELKERTKKQPKLLNFSQVTDFIRNKVNRI